jgi:hypothetical protein
MVAESPDVPSRELIALVQAQAAQIAAVPTEYYILQY